MRGPVVAVTAGLRQHAARWQDPRAPEETRLDGARPRRLEAAGIAHGREALVERVLDVARDTQDVVDQRLVPVVAALADQREVDMGVGEAR